MAFEVDHLRLAAGPLAQGQGEGRQQEVVDLAAVGGQGPPQERLGFHGRQGHA